MAKKTKKVIKAKHIKRTTYTRRKTAKEWGMQEVPEESLLGSVAYPTAEAYGISKKELRKATGSTAKTFGGLAAGGARETGAVLKGTGGLFKNVYESVKAPVSNYGWRWQKRVENWKEVNNEVDASKQALMDLKKLKTENAKKARYDRKQQILNERGVAGVSGFLRKTVWAPGTTTKENISINKAKMNRLKSIARNNGKVDVQNVRLRDKFTFRDVKRLDAPALKKLSEEELKNYNKIVKRRDTFENFKKGKIGSFLGSFTKAKGYESKAYKTGKYGTQLAQKGILRGGQALNIIGSQLSESAKSSISPIQIFQIAWAKMSTVMKLLVAIVFLFALLFVPIGVFYYAGWAVGAGFMFLVALIYWIFVNIFNGIATVAV
jgi:hypothetical protein